MIGCVVIFVVGVEVYFWLHQNRNCSHHKVFGFQQLCVDYFPTRDKTQHVTSGTLSVEADCGRKLEKQLPPQRYCCALIFLTVIHLSHPMIKTFGSSSADMKSGGVAKSVTCVLYWYCLKTACCACLCCSWLFNGCLDNMLAIEVGLEQWFVLLVSKSLQCFLPMAGFLTEVNWKRLVFLCCFACYFLLSLKGKTEFTVIL